MEKQELYDEVVKAIQMILVGGQSYKIGTRQLTRADLKELRAMKADLENEMSAANHSGFKVARFEGR
jgi:hypothetical protein